MKGDRVMDRTEKIMMRVWEHYHRAIAHYGEENVLGVFLYGSQNYNCDIESSDVDTKCILVPDLYHLALHPYKTTHLHIYADGADQPEVCECMTIQHMVANWKKQNPNFLEIMFTQFCAINPMYFDEWAKFLIKEGYREEIARYDVRAGVLSIAHQAIHTINQDPMNGKKIGNGARLCDLLVDYSAGINYNTCLKCDCAEMIKEFKAGTREVLPEHAGLLIERLEKFIDCSDQYPGPRRELDVPLDNFMMNLFRIRLSLDE
jgi:hypothetical protein